MKIILIGTNHTNREKDVEITMEYLDGDTWTFKTPQIMFTVSDLTPAMKFLVEDSNRE